jgi:hypothetical protein
MSTAKNNEACPYVISFDYPELVEFSKQIYWQVKDQSQLFFAQISDLITEDNKQLIFSKYDLNLKYHLFDSNRFELTKEKTKLLQEIVPFLSGVGYRMLYPPNYVGLPHIDGLSTSKNLFEYNLIVPIDNTEQTITRYYDPKLVTQDCLESFTQYLPEFKTLDSNSAIFSYTITKPTLFYNQHLHSATNYGDTTRSIITWKFLKDANLKEIITNLIDHGKKLEYIYNYQEE